MAGAVLPQPSEGTTRSPPASAAVLDPRLAGVWIKDVSRSDSMAEAMEAMRLNRLMRAAVGLIRRMEITGLDQGRFEFSVFSSIPWFKVREGYSLDGSVAQFNRRDLRRGKHTASATVRPDGALVLSVSWGEPLAGGCTDVVQVLPAGTTADGAGAVAEAEEHKEEGTESSIGGNGGSCSPVPHKDDVLLVTSTLRLGSGDSVREVVYKMVYTRKGR